MPKYKKALVTGGAGFVGSHLVDALMRRRVKVVVVDDLSTGRKENLNPNAKFFKMSVTSPSFPKLLKNVKPDVVFHLAAQIDVRKSVADPLADARTNILGTLALAQNARTAGVKKLVFASSAAVYADQKPPIKETGKTEPASPYGIAKYAGELYLRFIQETSGLPITALRFANVYGPRQSVKGEAGVVALFASRMLAGKSVLVNGTGRQTRDFVYVGDVVRALLAAADVKSGGVYNVGTGKETSVSVLFRKLNALTGAGLAETHGPGKPGEVMRSALDSRKAKKALGWEPKTNLDDGLEKTVRWFRKT